MTWLYIAAAILILTLAYFGLWALFFACSRADDANENAAMRKLAEDERKLKAALRPLREMDAGMGERKWRRRMEDKQ